MVFLHLAKYTFKYLKILFGYMWQRNLYCLIVFPWGRNNKWLFIEKSIFNNLIFCLGVKIQFFLLDTLIQIPKTNLWTVKPIWPRQVAKKFPHCANTLPQQLPKNVCKILLFRAHGRFRGSVNCGAPSMENMFKVTKFFIWSPKGF